MRAAYLLAGAALAVSSAWAVAQDAPESLLPKMFQEPAPTPSPTRTAAPRPAAPAGPAADAARPAAVATPVVQALPGEGAAADHAAGEGGEGGFSLKRVPTLEELAEMSPDEFADLLGSNVVFDMPPQARRSMERAGLLGESEGGLPADSLARQNARLIELALSENKGRLVSRWGHILLRRMLVSRLVPPEGMSPQDFLALRVALLLRMGETDAARAVLQDMDIADYTPAVGSVALGVYEKTADFTGLCPVMATQGSLQDGTEWNLAKAICEAFRGNSAVALSKLDREMARGKTPKVDLLLAQKYAGAAGKARRAVTIEWDNVSTMTPWRYGLAIGVGIEPPARLMDAAGPGYSYVTALAPMVGLERRAAAADRAGAAGVLSNAAMVDLYSQIYSDPGVTGDWQERAESLRDAYTLEDPQARFAAMKALWDSAGGPSERYAREVLTAAAAARMPAGEDLADDAPALIASMLSAGFDANAMRWAPVVPSGGQSWGLLALAAPGRTSPVETGSLDKFIDEDGSAGKRRAAFLVAGLAGLDRLGADEVERYSNDMSLGLVEGTRWTRAIDTAAQRGDSASVVLLAGFGMQGSNWSRMTPRYLFHIVSALRQVGFEGEARMIAAEAVARV
ncbi:hypothetical protein [Novosphingobium mangrovi (ex Huang et al. 2023)]|uniref:Lytic transglycosylase n=1 Tax=Novosphingobium mangrovi (ex Huang et al. 2023) TaxID=2976432 RepID=A0ABT2I8X6_9SPHN|nr:hypothetical protein [Novosphingobium mangrovi (ex Huang et al. 2023)]MCT2400992.1 hypothetical protein [Novosphingobium mangrovi (ex Huang et al. 2023)]